MAKFFSLLSLAGDEGDGLVNREESGGEHIREMEREEEERRLICIIKVCVMMPWVIFQIASNHSDLAVSQNAQGIRVEESVDVWRELRG